MTNESLEILRNTPVGETVEVEGRRIRVERHQVGDCGKCIDEVCGTGVYFRDVTDEPVMVKRDVTAEAEPIEYLTTREAARMLGMTNDKIREMVRRGIIKGHKAGEATGKHSATWQLEKDSVEAIAKATVETEIPSTPRTDESKHAGWASMSIGGTDWMTVPISSANSAAPDFATVATRLLPFDGVNKHTIWPLAVYGLENDDEPGCVNCLVFSIEGRQLMCSGTYGTREQAIEAGRADLHIRLKAVADMMGLEK